MMRSIVLVGLVVTILYCAAAGAVRVADASVASVAARPLARMQHQFIPGSLAALHAAKHNFAAAIKPRAVDPNA